MLTNISDLQDMLHRNGYAPDPLGSLGFRLTNVTPAHTFTTLVVLLPVLNYVAVLTARDFFDEHLATGIAEWLLTRQNKINLTTNIQLLDSFSYDEYEFSGILVLGPQCHRWFADGDSQLHHQTLEVFPTYKGEFSGLETPDQIEVLRHKVVCTIDWKRHPSPQAQVIINNMTTGISTEQSGFVLLSMPYLIHELQTIACDNDFVIVRNFLGQECVFSVKNDCFIVTSTFSIIGMQISRNQIDLWVWKFLVNGL